MGTYEKDVEAGTPIYAPKSSPKLDDLQSDRPAVVGASLPWLLLASMPRMAVQMAWTAQFIAVIPNVYDPVTARIISLSGPIVSLLVGPVMGVLSDRCKHKWGRRRPFLLFGAAATAVFMFAACCSQYIGQALGSYNATSVIEVTFYVCITVSICAIEIPATLLIADLAGDRQVTGAALGQGWSFLGTAVAVLYIKLFGDISSQGSFAAVLTILMILVIVIVVCTVKEEPREPAETLPDPPRGVLATIVGDLRPLSTTLAAYSVLVVLMQYGMATYNGSRVMFFETRVEKKSDDDYYSFRGDSGLANSNYFLAQLAAAYVFTWALPFLTNKIGAHHIITVSLVPVALLTIMAFSESETLVGLIDFVQAVFRGTLFVFIVPVIIQVYGTTKNLGARVGVYYCIGNIGQLLVTIIGGTVATTDLGYQLPVLLGGIMAIVCMVISIFGLKLTLKSF